MKKSNGFLLIDSCMVIVITATIVLLTFSITLIISKQNQLIKQQINIIDENYRNILSNQPACIINIIEDEQEVIDLQE